MRFLLARGIPFSQNKFISRPKHFGGIVRQLTRVFLNLEVGVDVCARPHTRYLLRPSVSLSLERSGQARSSISNVSSSPSLFLLCLSVESLSARATFDLYAHKSRFAAAIQATKAATRYRVAAL